MASITTDTPSTILAPTEADPRAASRSKDRGVDERPLFLAAVACSLLMTVTACTEGTGGTSHGGGSNESSHASQGGFTSVSIAGFGVDGIGVSHHALTNGPTTVFEWEQLEAPNDGPGFDLDYTTGSDGRYHVRSSEGYSEWGGETLLLLLDVLPFVGPGTYSTAAHPDTTVYFAWEGETDEESGAQYVFELDLGGEDDCSIVIESDMLSGALTCTGLAPFVNGQLAEEGGFSLDVAWTGHGTEY